MKIKVNSIRFLLQSVLRLLHVVRNRVIRHKSARLRCIVQFRRVEKGGLEEFLVHIQHLSLRIGFVEAKGH